MVPERGSNTPPAQQGMAEAHVSGPRPGDRDQPGVSASSCAARAWCTEHASAQSVDVLGSCSDRHMAMPHDNEQDPFQSGSSHTKYLRNQSLRKWDSVQNVRWRTVASAGRLAVWCTLALALQLPTQAHAESCTPLPTVNAVGAKLGIHGTVTDPSKKLNGVPVLGPQVIIADASIPQRERLDIMVGSELELNITASWGGPYVDHNLTLYAYEDPGVPNGAVLTTQVCN